MTEMTSPSGSTIAETEAFLAAHPDIEAFDIVLHDANGIGRGKIIRRHELLSFYKGGRHLPISILGLDICGEDVHETGLIWDQGDGDLRAQGDGLFVAEAAGVGAAHAGHLVDLRKLGLPLGVAGLIQFFELAHHAHQPTGRVLAVEHGDGGQQSAFAQQDAVHLGGDTHGAVGQVGDLDGGTGGRRGGGLGAR